VFWWNLPLALHQANPKGIEIIRPKVATCRAAVESATLITAFHLSEASPVGFFNVPQKAVRDETDRHICGHWKPGPLLRKLRCNQQETIQIRNLFPDHKEEGEVIAILGGQNWSNGWTANSN
jgi:hypothetical protein